MECDMMHHIVVIESVATSNCDLTAIHHAVNANKARIRAGRNEAVVVDIPWNGTSVE